MNKFLSAIYRNDHHSLDVYIQRRTGKDRHEINEALQVLIGDTDLNKKERINYVQTLLLAGTRDVCLYHHNCFQLNP